MSIALSPSTRAGWVLVITATRPPATARRRGTSPTAGGVRSSGREVSRATRSSSCASRARTGQPGAAHVVGDVEVRVVDPDRVGQVPGHLGDPLAVPRHEREPGPHQLGERLGRGHRRGASRIEHPADVHRRVRAPPGRGRRRPVAVSRSTIDLLTGAASHATRRRQVAPTPDRSSGHAGPRRRRARRPPARPPRPAPRRATAARSAAASPAATSASVRPAASAASVARRSAGRKNRDLPAGEPLQRRGDLLAWVAGDRPAAHLVDHERPARPRAARRAARPAPGCCAAAPPDRRR